MATDSETRTIPRHELEDATCHANEIQKVVQAAADRLDDNHLHLAARSLEQLNENLADLTYNE